MKDGNWLSYKFHFCILICIDPTAKSTLFFNNPRILHNEDVKPHVNQWKTTLRNVVGIPTVNRRMLSQIFDGIQSDVALYS